MDMGHAATACVVPCMQPRPSRGILQVFRGLAAGTVAPDVWIRRGRPCRIVAPVSDVCSDRWLDAHPDTLLQRTRVHTVFTSWLNRQGRTSMFLLSRQASQFRGLALFDVPGCGESVRAPAIRAE